MFLNTNPFIKNATYIDINVTNVYNPYRHLALISPIGAFDPYI